MDSLGAMAESLMILPNHPFASGETPSHVEYEGVPLEGEPKRVVAPVGEAADLDLETPFRIRYRYLWAGVPGAWSDEGITWQRPR